MTIMIKVMTIMGTRPEAIKLAPVIKEIAKYKRDFQSIIVLTAQHREMLDQVLALFEIKADHDLNIMREGQNLFHISSRALHGLQKVIEKEKPDIALVEGDTTTVFIASLAAFYYKIPIAHIEAGLRSFNKYHPFPEEINRKLVTVLTDLHFAPTQKAKKNLLEEGVPEEKIFVTGNPVIDALFMKVKENYYFTQPEIRKIDFEEKRVILVTAHRRENFGEPLRNICFALKEIIDSFPDVEIVYPVHPNPNIQKPVKRLLGEVGRIHLLEPLGYDSLVNLMNQCYLMLTDSGGIQEEAPSLGKPVLVLRAVTERPEAVTAGTVKVIGTEKENIVRETKILLENKEEYQRMARAINPYGDGKAAERIIEILLNYKKDLD